MSLNFSKMDTSPSEPISKLPVYIHPSFMHWY
jgi:hypothetical protein